MAADSVGNEPRTGTSPRWRRTTPTWLYPDGSDPASELAAHLRRPNKVHLRTGPPERRVATRRTLGGTGRRRRRRGLRVDALDLPVVAQPEADDLTGNPTPALRRRTAMWRRCSSSETGLPASHRGRRWPRCATVLLPRPERAPARRRHRSACPPGPWLPRFIDLIHIVEAILLLSQVMTGNCARPSMQLMAVPMFVCHAKCLSLSWLERPGGRARQWRAGSRSGYASAVGGPWSSSSTRCHLRRHPDGSHRAPHKPRSQPRRSSAEDRA